MYLDAAHGGWLGWPNNLAAAAQISKEKEKKVKQNLKIRLIDSSQIYLKVLNLAGGPNLIRGFATNTANYQPLGSLTSTGIIKEKRNLLTLF